MNDPHTHPDLDDQLSRNNSGEVYAPSAPHKEGAEGSQAPSDERSSTTAQPKRAGLLATCLVMLATVMPAGGMLATSFNMASTAIGAGILGLPAATGDTGYIMTLIYLIAITAETVYSMVLLVQASQLCGERTYERMANKLFFHGADYIVAAIRFVYCFGCCIAYVICVMNLITPILTDEDGSSSGSSSSSDPTFWHDKNKGVRVITFILWFCCMLPLVIPRDVNSLRYVSTIGVLFFLYFVIVIVVRSISSGMHGSGVVPVVTGNDAVSGIGVFIFSYMCQVNSNDIFYEMTSGSIKRFALCTIISMSICGTLYYIVGIFGYLQFGSSLSGSILLKYDPLHEPDVMISFIGVFIKVCASYGLLANACRNSLYHVLRWDPMTVAFWKHCIAVVCLSVGFLVAGLFIPNVNLVFGFDGGVCGGTLAFIFPALFRMYVGDWNAKTVGWINYIFTYLTLYGGCVGIVFGTMSTVYSVM